jgi:hypothetical protein
MTEGPFGGDARRRAAEARLEAAIAAELLRPAPRGAVLAAAHARALHDPSTGAVLFYGSCLRGGTGAGMLDLYVVPESYRAFHRGAVAAALNWLVPPTLYRWTLADRDGTLRIKVAVVSRRQFAAACRPAAWSPSIWARFCQPALLVHATDGAATALSRDLVRAVMTASRWAALLGPACGRPRDYWVALFRATYGTELRPERADRAASLYDAAPARYDRFLVDGWEAAAVPFVANADGTLRPSPGDRARQRGRMAWAARRSSGKVLSIVRLLKGAFTFEDPLDYLVWKIERHSGVNARLSPWQRRHPVLAAPLVFVDLLRRGAVR